MNDPDGDLKAAFSSARKADRDSAPGFRQLRHRPAPTPSPGSFRLGFVAGGLTSLIVAAASIWIVFEEPQVLRRITGRAEPAAGFATLDGSSSTDPAPGSIVTETNPVPGAAGESTAASGSLDDDEVPIDETPENYENPDDPSRRSGLPPLVPPAGGVALVPAQAEAPDGAVQGGVDPRTLGREIPADTVTIGVPGDPPEPEPFQLDPGLRRAPAPSRSATLDSPGPRTAPGKPGAFVTKETPGTRPPHEAKLEATRPDGTGLEATKPNSSTDAPATDTRSGPARKRFVPRFRQTAAGARSSDAEQGLIELGELSGPGTGTRWIDLAQMLRGMEPDEGRQALRVMKSAFSTPDSRIGFQLLDQYLGDAQGSEKPVDTGFILTNDNPLSEFPLEVGSASWSELRSSLGTGELPSKSKLRIEELVNQFPYDYPEPRGREEFAVDVEVATCLWNPDNRLARIAIKARENSPFPVNATALVEFNAMEVGAYRLIGVDPPVFDIESLTDPEPEVDETAEPLRTVTMLYEIVPRGSDQPAASNTFRPGVRQVYWAGNQSGELFTLTLEYELGDRHRPGLLIVPLIDDDIEFAAATPDFKFAAAVAAFGLLLVDSPHKGGLDYHTLQRLIDHAIPPMPGGYRDELFDMVSRARNLAERRR